MMNEEEEYASVGDLVMDVFGNVGFINEIIRDNPHYLCIYMVVQLETGYVQRMFPAEFQRINVR
jgi:hypothetical protein